MFDCTIKFDFQSEGDTIRIYSFDQFRPSESAVFPNIIDITQASTRALAYIDKGEHIEDPTVAGITDTTRNGFINADTKCAGI